MAGKKAELAVNFVLRVIVGVIAIFFINKFLGNLGYERLVGLSVVTVLTVGTLGFPGVLLLYALNFFFLL